MKYFHRHGVRYIAMALYVAIVAIGWFGLHVELFCMGLRDGWRDA